MTGDPPSRIAHYDIVREVGRGGMGIVYLAHDSRLDRPVAIKSLPEHVADDPERLARFEREARSLAQLNHPNAAGIFGVEEQDGQRYLILEFVDGPTLGERLDAGPIPPDEAIEIAVQIAGGLEAAHEAGVVHRDLKPDNVKLTNDGKVKVLDFGLAKPDGTGTTTLADAATLQAGNPTEPGVILGTAAYMSPEQARGRHVDKRTDIWSFGVVLYEMLTGASPFAGETISDSIGAVLHTNADLERLPPATPSLVRHVLRRCLERDRSRRYRDLGDVRLDLEDAASDSRPGDGLTARRSSPFWRTAGLTLALLIVGVTLVAILRPAPRPELVRTAIRAPDDVMIHDFTLSTDGRHVAFIGEPITVGDRPGPRTPVLYTRDLSSAALVIVPRSGGVFDHAYAPGGETLAFITRGPESSAPEQLMRVPADLSADPVAVMRVPGSYHWGVNDWFCWTPDGEIALLDRRDGAIGLFDAGTGREIRRVPLLFDGPTPDLGGLEQPFGNRFIQINLQRFTPTGFQIDCGLIDLTTGRLSRVASDAGSLSLLPTGDVLFARREVIFRAPFDSAELQLTGTFTPVQTGLMTRRWARGAYALSANGSLLYKSGGVHGQSRRVVLVDRTGDERIWSDEQRAFEESIGISADGSLLAVTIAGSGGLYELWISDVNRPRLRRLLADPGTDYYAPVFTPNNEHLIVSSFCPSSDIVGRMLLVRIDGSEPPTVVHAGWDVNDWVVPASISADGTSLLIERRSGGRVAILEQDLSGGGKPRPLIEGENIFTPRYAVDGSPLIAYVSTETGRAEAFVRVIDGQDPGPPIPVTARGAWQCNWIIDPEAGLCLMHFDLGWREWITPVACENGRVHIGESTPTGRLGNTRTEASAMTADGRRFCIRFGDDERPATHLELVQGWLDAIDDR